MEKTIQILGHSYHVEPEIHRYRGTQNNALILRDMSDFGQIKASLNIASAKELPSDAVWIKDYAENAGIADELIRVGIILPKVVQSHLDVIAGEIINAYQMSPDIIG